MAFCLYELALQPDVQQRLRDEIEAVTKEVSNGDVTYDAIAQMTYLEQVLSGKNSLNLYRKPFLTYHYHP